MRTKDEEGNRICWENFLEIFRRKDHGRADMRTKDEEGNRICWENFCVEEGTMVE